MSARYPMDRAAYNLEEVAHFCGCTVQAVYGRIHAGKLAWVQVVRRRYVVLIDDLQSWFNPTHEGGTLTQTLARSSMLRVCQVARSLGVSPSTIRRLIARGALPASQTRPTALLRIRSEDLAEFLLSRRQPARAA